MLPLVRHALVGSTITYLGLKKIVEPDISNSWALHYNHVAGRVGDICEALGKEMGETIPPLNAIVVNGQTKLPSYGVDHYLARFLGFSGPEIGRLSQEERDAYARQAIHSVFDYNGWPEVCRRLRLRVPIAGRKRVPGPGSRLPDPRGFSTGRESAAHKDLKIWAASNPEFFADYGTFGIGETEVTLSSGDRLDAYFEGGASRLAVEVKSVRSPHDEIERGVFQCVKYRSVLRAMQSVLGHAPNAQAVLVLDGPPPAGVSGLAATLTVNVFDVSDSFRAGG
ncbi:hypothetical protein EBE87_21555 [Pseudoroseomonas wenyumeiae]|uniref:Uncharacterized protein n=1 Tax=Teichococcus wenyumeiae TaxID=2478470 RepID=A0A3A9J9P2_9PROT|nr:hypothetical protein [Pseudoroseomonas wenyumeiae]RKK03152.1 hypothetical protein D6Z83_16060 [Pseudoroseomonas wenyumeiae]RMI19206.1 hypothetical protein EBE87_21555 [Pseudoroseomonas wenyumeiae]